jgi:predicted permease
VGLVREAEIVDELAQDLRDRYETLLAKGIQPDDAYRTVITDLEEGQLAEELRRVEQNYIEPVALGANASGGVGRGIWQDVRYGARVLRLNPAFTIVSILSLALGIGANTAIFQLLDAVRMRALPVKDPQTLAIIQVHDRKWGSGRWTGRYATFTNALWEQLRDRQQGFSSIAAWGSTAWNLKTGGQAQYARGIWVSGDFFNTVGVPALLGRVFTPQDDVRGCGAPSAVLSYAFWQRQYGGDPAVVGRKIMLEGHPFDIVGVTPAAFYGVEVGRSFDVAAPICAEPLVNGEQSILDMKHGWWLAMIGRLKPGWTFERATAQLKAISVPALEATIPPAYQADSVKHYMEYRFEAIPGGTGFSNLRKTYETPLWMLLAIAGLVLLIACANLANLLLARASAREREIAVRLALGASRWRLVRQLLTESVLLAFSGALLGILLAQALSRVMVRFLSTENSRLFLDLAVDWRVLGFTIGLALLTCLVFGLTPAVRATGGSPARVMNASGRGLTSTRERFTLRRALVITQVALSLVLVVSALLFVRTLRNIMTLDAGFQRDGLLIMDVDAARLNLPKDQRLEYKRRLVERVRAIPGVLSAAEVSITPVSGSGWNQNVIVNGHGFVDPKDGGGKTSLLNRVGPGFFKTMGTPMLGGRDFDDAIDTATSPKVAIVNQEFVKQFLGGENPIGKTFSLEVSRGEKQEVYQVVGLVRNMKYYELKEDFSPIAVFPMTQDDKPDLYDEVLVRSELQLDSLLSSLRRTVAETSPNINIDFHVFRIQLRDGLARERMLATLSGFFGFLAAVLATVGLYGVISYTVVRRTNEIGIRMALGATPLRIMRMIVFEAGNMLLFGLGIGIVLSLLATRTAQKLLFGLKPHDAVSLAAAAVLLAGVAIAASLLPARRAAHLEPMTALREE